MIRRILAAAALLTVASCASRPPDESNYVGRVAADRAKKDAVFGDSATPIPREAHARFLPLAYFAVDPAFAVPASFTEDPPAARVRMEMQTSAHQPRLMERIGTLAFTLQGQALRLSAFREVGETTDRLFVPFTDLTTGKQSYPAGRYLDIARSSTGIYVVDFNLAYNPYCYYNPTYDCPYPPKENRLAVAITAGEKTTAR
jgi:uncharacterized protein (DUF1684 family)